MNEWLPSLLAAIVGVLIALYAILRSVRTRPAPSTRLGRLESAGEPAVLLSGVIHGLQEKRSQTVDPIEIALLDGLIESMASQHAEVVSGVTSACAASTEATNAPMPHADEREVEVQGSDGSRVTLSVDPDDADSIHRFLNSARRFGGERVVAVH